MSRIIVFVATFLLINISGYAQSDIFDGAAGKIEVVPVYHGSLVMNWGEKSIYIDPHGGAERYSDFNAPDLVLITHAHGDHLDTNTLRGLDLQFSTLVAPESVIEEMGSLKFMKTHSMANGDSLEILGLLIEAIPMYNLPREPTSFHPKGWGNGYVLNFGIQRFYISGDTEDIPEMRKLMFIDAAFVCMNQPYTMTVEQAADAVLEFQPKVVYPYHYRGKGGMSDVKLFKTLIEEGERDIEVRLRSWYE